MTPRPSPKFFNRAGFTLVELMVAITAGLIISVMVFALAKDANAFYRRETRAADATMGTLIGFERLRGDISRAGFLSSANVYRDPMFCGTAADVTAWDGGPLKQLASLSIETETQANIINNPVLTAAGIVPQRITLAGSFDGIEEFPTADIQACDAGCTGYRIFLQTNVGPLARMNYLTRTDKAALLSSLFTVGRAMRIVSVSGRLQFGVLTGVGIDTATNLPRLVLKDKPALNVATAAGTPCSLRGGQNVVNVINFIRYRLDTIGGDPTLDANLAPLANNGNPWDVNRLELFREELSPTGTVLSREVVAEYAVDLRFAISAVPVANVSNSQANKITPYDFGNSSVITLTQPMLVGTMNTSRPQLVRSVVARLSIRSRDPDRTGDVTAASDVATGMYRINLDTTGTNPAFARVRTLRSEIGLPAHAGLTWL